MEEREDWLPEEYEYRDEGCEVYPSCLRCPLPRCRYDEPEGGRFLIKERRNGEVRRRHREGWTVGRLAAHFGVSRRTIQRILRREARD